MSDSEIINVLRAYMDYLHVTNFLSDGLRWVGYKILYGIAVLLDLLTKGFQSAYKVLNFWSYGPLQNYIKQYQTVIWALAVLALSWAGLMFMHNKNVDYHEKINNFMVAILLFFGLTFVMTQGTAMLNAAIGSTLETTPAVNLFKGNITDVYAIDKAGWPHTGTKNTLGTKHTLNQISDMSDLALLDINETADTGGLFGGSQVSEKGKSILVKQLSKNNDGKYELHNMKNWSGIGNSSYYRYSWHPWYLFADLMTSLVVMAFLILKTIRIGLEINFIGVLGQGISLTDIDSGKRNRQLIGKLRDTFVVGFLLVVIAQFYSLFLGFLNTINLGTPIKIFAMIAAAGFVIDGPNIIQSIFGIDAGISSAAQSFTNMVFAGRGISSMTKGAGRMAKNLTKTAGKGIKGGMMGAAGIAGFGKGVTKKPELPKSDSLKDVAAEVNGPSIPATSPEDQSSPSANSAPSSPGVNAMSSGNGTPPAMAPGMPSSTPIAISQPPLVDQGQASIGGGTQQNGALGTIGSTPSAPNAYTPTLRSSGVLGGSAGSRGRMSQSGNGTAPQLPHQIGAGDGMSMSGLGTNSNGSPIAQGQSREKGSEPNLNQVQMPPLQAGSSSSSGSDNSKQNAPKQALGGSAAGNSTTPGLPQSTEKSGYRVPKMTIADMPKGTAKEARGAISKLKHDQREAAITGDLISGARMKITQSPTVRSVQRAYRIGENTGARLVGRAQSAPQQLEHTDGKE